MKLSGPKPPSGPKVSGPKAPSAQQTKLAAMREASGAAFRKALGMPGTPKLATPKIAAPRAVAPKAPAARVSGPAREAAPASRLGAAAKSPSRAMLRNPGAASAMDLRDAKAVQTAAKALDRAKPNSPNRMALARNVAARFADQGMVGPQGFRKQVGVSRQENRALAALYDKSLGAMSRMDRFKHGLSVRLGAMRQRLSGGRVDGGESGAGKMGGAPTPALRPQSQEIRKQIASLVNDAQQKGGSARLGLSEAAVKGNAADAQWHAGQGLDGIASARAKLMELGGPKGMKSLGKSVLAQREAALDRLNSMERSLKAESEATLKAINDPKIARARQFADTVMVERDRAPNRLGKLSMETLKLRRERLKESEAVMRAGYDKPDLERRSAMLGMRNREAMDVRLKADPSNAWSMEQNRAGIERDRQKMMAAEAAKLARMAAIRDEIQRVEQEMLRRARPPGARPSATEDYTPSAPAFRM